MQWHAYIDVKDCEGHTALVKATHGGHPSVARELLNHGANVTLDMILCPLIDEGSAAQTPA